MRKATGNTERTMRAPRTLAAIAALACLGFVAAPAQAGGELRDAFEDQMGRLLAVEALHTGKWILSGGYYGHHGTQHYGVRPAWDHQRRHHYEPRGHGHYRHHAKRHHAKRHHRSWNRNHHHYHYDDQPCNVETHVIQRDRWGDVEYERHERRTRGERHARW